MNTVWKLFILLAYAGGIFAGEQCTDTRAESQVRYCEYGCCVESGGACCGFPTWILIVGFIGGAIVVIIIVVAVCCVAYKIQNAKLKQSVGPANRQDDQQVIHVTSRPVYPPPSARYSSAQTSEYSYCAHELYEQPHFRQTFYTPDKDLNLYTSTCTSDSESHTGNIHETAGYINKPDDVFSDRTSRSRNQEP